MKDKLSKPMTGVRDSTETAKKKGGNDPSILTKMLFEYFLEPPLWKSVMYLNVLFIYFILMVVLLGFSFSYWYLMGYIIFVFSLNSWRLSIREKERLEVAHRIPFFAEALANSLSVGCTLEQACSQSSFYLKGKIKEEFEKLIIKNNFGKELGELLNKLDEDFPRTGLRYLTSLLIEYKELGVGISPMLKRVSQALTKKAEAEEKVLAILSAGSSYARISIVIFVLIFSGMSFLLKDQVSILFSPMLKPTFLFLIAWTFVGVLVVIRITSLGFAKTFSLRPYIQTFSKNKKLSFEDLLYYSGVDWTENMRKALFYAPFIFGLVGTYFTSLYSNNISIMLFGGIAGAAVFWFSFSYVLKGLVEDQLIRTIEAFPEMLQVFIIGLNSGLNIYLSFQFAQDAIRGSAPRLLNEELTRTKFALECGESFTATWQHLAERLPFEIVVDFAEIMMIAPIHGESVVNSVTQMMNTYQEKKLLLIQKKATVLGQMVIPIIVVAFFPLFLFAVFAPLISNIAKTL